MLNLISQKLQSHQAEITILIMYEKQRCCKARFFYFLVLGTFGVEHRVGEGNKNEMRKMLQSE